MIGGCVKGEECEGMRMKSIKDVKDEECEGCEEGKGICPELKGLWRLIGEHRKTAV